MFPGGGADKAEGRNTTAMRAMGAVNALGGSPMPLSYGEVIANDLANAEQRVAQLQRIQELLAKNPEFEELLTLVGRVGRY